MLTLSTTPRPNRANPMAWAARAACIGRPELMDQKGSRKARAALELCEQCPVLAECRAWAEAEGSYVGVAGGRVYVEKRSAA